MEGSSPETALARIDAAIARLVAVASRPTPAPGHADTAAGHIGSDLAARHQALRTAVSQALSQLDGLIAGQGV